MKLATIICITFMVGAITGPHIGNAQTLKLDMPAHQAYAFAPLDDPKQGWWPHKTLQELIRHRLPAGWKTDIRYDKGGAPQTDNKTLFFKRHGSQKTLITGWASKHLAANLATLMRTPVYWGPNACLNDGIGVVLYGDDFAILEVLPRAALDEDVVALTGVPANLCKRDDRLASSAHLVRKAPNVSARFATFFPKEHADRNYVSVPKARPVNKGTPPAPIDRNLPQANAATRLIDDIQVRLYNELYPPGVDIAPMRHLRAFQACSESKYIQPEDGRNVHLHNYLILIDDYQATGPHLPDMPVIVATLIPQPRSKNAHERAPDRSVKENYVLIRSEVTHCIVDPRDFMVLGRFQEESPYFVDDAVRPSAKHP